jgi:hypothetical protein
LPFSITAHQAKHGRLSNLWNINRILLYSFTGFLTP